MNSIKDPVSLEKLNAALSALDEEKVRVDGIWLKPSQCYHVGNDPSHILFNTNCPDELKEKITALVSTYSLPGEGRS